MYEKKYEAAKSVKEKSLSIKPINIPFNATNLEENDNNNQVQYLEQFLKII